ncbi:MAG: prepilin-type N-terminal cleavage/methylation domain-containing protein [Candidatus Omnitrophota bacterium]
MLKVSGSKKGFTLIELMVVAIIVAILAVVAIPLMRGNTEKAIATEAESALGAIRNAMRVGYSEKGAYNNIIKNITAGTKIGNGDKVCEVEGLNFKKGTTTAAGDLDGTYFEENCYVVTAVAADTFTITCNWATGNSVTDFSPKAQDAIDFANTTIIDQGGKITRTGY